ncbi:MAG: BREX-1 system adenine-specific DNA-methyltransferase PglX, partial [Tissierellaceae bacterium]
EDLYELQYKEVILEKMPPLIQQGKIMSQKYDVVSTNPPYMGTKGMSSKLSKYLAERFGLAKYDMYSSFIIKALNLTKGDGYTGLITQQSWMFLSRYEKFRDKLLRLYSIRNLIHLGPRAFAEISGEVVQTTTFILSKNVGNDYKAKYISLERYNSADLKQIEFFNEDNYYSRFRQGDFSIIPSKVISYWVSENFINTFINEKPLDKVAETKKGLVTSDNNRFLRLWWEIEYNSIGFELKSGEDTILKNKKWIPLNKGGGFRKWYGNNEYLINWGNNGKEIITYAAHLYGTASRQIQNVHYYFRKGLTWSGVSSNNFGIRRFNEGFIFDTSGPCLFSDMDDYLLGLMNSRVFNKYLSTFIQTLSINPKDVSKVPIITVDDKHLKNRVENLADVNYTISKTDWDTFETSWDFKVHPLANFNKYMNNYYDSLLESGILADRESIYVNNLEHAYEQYKEFTEGQFNQLKANEEELNRIFIEVYGLQDELTPEVEDKDITISKADRERDIKSFISYAVGCMFGRYSLDEEGLIYAGGDFGDKFRKFNEDWEIKTGDGWKQSSTKIAEHNVIPIADGDYFEDDILERFVEFVKVSFGRDTLEENLEYIAETLGKRANETSRQAIRRYFLRDFYKDHVRIYKKRPIYWLFDSGRQNGFKALIYMHRYNPYSLARVRTDYLHSLQKKYEGEINHLDILIDSDISNREKAAARKNKETILKQIQECRLYDEALAHVANQRIEIDLDDGVKVNYDKFQGIKIPQGEGRKPLKADLLAKI